VNLAAHELVSEAVRSLPLQWQHDVARAEKQSTAALTHTLDSAVTAVEIERRKPSWWNVAGFFQVLFFLATVVGALWLILQLVLVFSGVLTGGGAWLWTTPAVLLVGGIVGSAVTSALAGSARGRGAREAGAEVDERLRDAVQQAAAGSYLEPITAILREHRSVYDGLR
jgi:hypothetical protein